MNLVNLTLHGYRRFENKTSIQLDGKVVAIVGPNEAGKSSILTALRCFSEANPLTHSGPGQDLTRGAVAYANRDVIQTKYLLEEDDLRAISHLHGGDKCRWVNFSRRMGSTSTYIGTSPPLLRDCAPRNDTRKLIKDNSLFRSHLETYGPRPAGSSASPLYDELVSIIESNADTLEADQVSKINAASLILQEVVDEMEVDEPDTEDDGQNTSSSSAKDAAALQEAARLLEYLHSHELLTAPSVTARKILLDRMPEFLLFDEDERDLEPAYDLSNMSSGMPPALSNLFRLASLDKDELLNARNQNDNGRIASLEAAANDKLRHIFEQVWSQSGVSVRLRIDGNTVHVLVGSSDTQYVSIADRSDGLRQFVALLAFVSVSTTSTSDTTKQPPVLLVDEAETHLHYDAQADMVQMFARQQIASKVIYTTHSLGCLPEDLGTGVRLVEPFDNRTSTVRNWFWENSAAGFSPLLYGMGARTMAFLPVRYSLLTEGATDVILLPSLLREATGREYLGFQVVPGLSSANGTEMGLVEREAIRTAYLVDADDGGTTLVKQLRKVGIPDTRIFRLPDPDRQKVTLEDMVAAEVYLRAINEELRRSHGDGFVFPSTELPQAGRSRAVDTWCESCSIGAPNKRAVAYRILEQRADGRVLSEQHKAGLRDLYAKIQTALGIS